MKEDPFDPHPDSDWSTVAFLGLIIAGIIIGVWFWAHSLINKAFHPQPLPAQTETTTGKP